MAVAENTIATFSPGAFLFSLLSNNATHEEKVKAVESVLESHGGQAFRSQMADWVLQFLPVDQLVPDKYAHWRPLVRDAKTPLASALLQWEAAKADSGHSTGPHTPDRSALAPRPPGSPSQPATPRASTIRLYEAECFDRSSARKSSRSR